MNSSRFRLAAAWIFLYCSFFPLFIKPVFGDTTKPNQETTQHIRITAITDRLIRLEYAPDGQFTDRSTFFVRNRNFSNPEFRSEVNTKWVVVQTKQATVRYRRGSGRFFADNITATVSVNGTEQTIYPAMFETDSAHNASNLGGWRYDLGFVKAATHVHPGLLSQDGWHVLDDSHTPYWGGGEGWPVPKDTSAQHQDWYLFLYGHDYQDALRDFAELTGHPPLLPRWAFGIWFSRLHDYTAEEYRRLILPNMRENNIPLDALIIDTDWKAPDRWDGWNWSPTAFPEPDSFLQWTDRAGLRVALNIHPSIKKDDPQFPKADSIAGGLVTATGQCPQWQGGEEPCAVWDWGLPTHANSYFSLHTSFEHQGVDFWWLDWCCDASRVTLPGLTPDSWINARYALRMNREGKRGFSLSRIGSSWQDPAAAGPGPWAEHRYSIHFTGDTYPTWKMLEFQTEFTVMEGNMGIPYISHDIGSFHAGGPRAKPLSQEMYIRWIQFGAFQPIFRLHGHGKRLPWMFEEPAKTIAAEFMRLRHSLIPYLYNLARESHQTGLPMARGMYLHYPEFEEAYTFKHQYLLGEKMLVAPIASPGDTVHKQVWLPPGTWFNFFTQEKISGPAVHTVSVPLDQIPVFVKAGTVIPLQPYMDFEGQKPVEPLILKVFPGDSVRFTLYEDEGSGTEFLDGAFQHTLVTMDSDDGMELHIRSQSGKPGYHLMPDRSYRIEIQDVDRPEEVLVNGKRSRKIGVTKAENWVYSQGSRILLIYLKRLPIDLPISIIIW